MLVHPSEAGEPRECKAWLKQIVLRGASVHIPEIADYELRRELLRMKSDESVKRLDQLKTRLIYVPITTAAMLKAAEYWATTRGAGRPTADEKALDGDVIRPPRARRSSNRATSWSWRQPTSGTSLSSSTRGRGGRSSDLRELRGGASGLCCPHPQLSPGQSP